MGIIVTIYKLVKFTSVTSYMYQILLINLKVCWCSVVDSLSDDPLYFSVNDQAANEDLGVEVKIGHFQDPSCFYVYLVDENLTRWVH